MLEWIALAIACYLAYRAKKKYPTTREASKKAA
jgi:hypothetical protein